LSDLLDQFRQLVENVNAVLWLTSVDSQELTYVSPAVERVFGVGAEALRNRFDLLYDVVHPEDREALRQASARQVEGEWQHHFRIRRPDGELRWILARSSPVRDQSGKVVSIANISEDVTECMEREVELRRLQQALDQSQKLEALGQLAAGLAHDFNNLLVPILGYSQIAIETLGEDAPIAEDMRAILQAGSQAKELTQALLAFARKQGHELGPVQLSEEVRSFAAVLRRMLREDIELSLELDEQVKPIRADATGIRQVLLNLASNAQDAMPDGGVLRVRTLSLPPDPEAREPWEGLGSRSFVVLMVEDNGKGMDEKTQAHIFEPFFTTKAQQAGTGLGLAMVYGCVRQHDGQIRCTSRLGEGTRFEMLFPTMEETRTAPKAPLTEPPPGSSRRTILLVEDHKSVRSLLARVLANEGYRVVEAATGREALTYATTATPESIGLLVTDMVLPDTRGYDLFEQLSEMHSGVRVLYLSGYALDPELARRMPQALFLPKPFAVDQFKRMVRRALHS